jgi:uncharacterized RDD family membrane protein YckC
VAEINFKIPGDKPPAPEASPGRRFLAILIDWLMCRSIIVLLGSNSYTENQFSTLILFYLEVAFFTYVLQASAGQRIMGIMVVDAFDDSRVGLNRILIRTLLICLVLPAVWTKNSVPLHNLFTRTKTIAV